MVNPEILYRMPARQTVERARGSGFLEHALPAGDLARTRAAARARPERVIIVED